jgi:hypothetical protein
LTALKAEWAANPTGNLELPAVVVGAKYTELPSACTDFDWSYMGSFNDVNFVMDGTNDFS